MRVSSFYPNSFLPRFHPLFSTLFPDCNAASPWCHLHPTPPPPRVPATAAPPTTAKRKMPPHPPPFAIRHHCLAPPTDFGWDVVVFLTGWLRMYNSSLHYSYSRTRRKGPLS
ncbi:hypothetical protein ACS0TY_017788 [Phlomoides rotata]